MADQDQRHAAFGHQVAQQVQDLRLHCHVQRRGWLVGDQHIRVTGQRGRDHDALALSAGKLVRIVVQPLTCIGNADPVQQFDRMGQRCPPVHGAVLAQRLGHLVADALQWIQCRHGLLEHHPQIIATQGAQCLFAGSYQLLPIEHDAAFCPGVARQQAHQGQHGQRLAAARFADHAQGFAALQREAHVAHGGCHTPMGAHHHVQVADFQQCHQRPPSLILGSSRSRRASPRKFSPSTASAIATPGYTASMGWLNISVCASASMRPQLGCGGCVPRPR